VFLLLEIIFMSQEKLLLHGHITRVAWKFAIPTIISMVVTALYNIVDRIFIGHIPNIGSLAMTGLGLTIPAITISFALVMLFSIGTATLVSLKLGAKKPDQAQKLFTNATTLVICSQLLFMVISWLLQSQILRALGADDITLPYARDYLNIITGGYLLLGLSFLFSGVLRSAGHAAISTICNVTGTLINIVLDAVFIYVFNWGIAGAAWATIISQAIGLLVIIWFFKIKKNSLPIHLPRFPLTISIPLTAKVVQIGFAPCAMQLAGSVVIILVNSILLEYGGNTAVAAMTIIFSLMNLTNLPLIGYIQGIQPLVGFNYGAKAYTRVRQVIVYSFKALLAMGLINTFFIFFLTRPLINIFTTDQEVVAITTHGVRIFLGLIILVGPQILCSSYFQFIGKAKQSAFLTLLRQVIVLIPLLLILPRFFGVEGVWWTWLLTDIISTAICLYIFYRDFRRLPQHDHLANTKKLHQIARQETAETTSPVLKGIAEIESI
jgi:putative MATE family efflux protein